VIIIAFRTANAAQLFLRTKTILIIMGRKNVQNAVNFRNFIARYADNIFMPLVFLYGSAVPFLCITSPFGGNCSTISVFLSLRSAWPSGFSLFPSFSLRPSTALSGKAAVSMRKRIPNGHGLYAVLDVQIVDQSLAVP
jgi:hypothetical protein